jgi:hypothetical protein
MRLHLTSAARRRALIVVALCSALVVPATASFAAPDSQTTGTMVGSVTCGPAEETPAAQARIAVEGMDLATSTDSAGKFTLANVPTVQFLTVDAMADPSGLGVVSRYNVAVQPGAVTDIGNLDLSVCPQPQPALSSEQTPDELDNAP